MVFSFPEDFYTTDPNFTTLFRLLDDFDTYSREVQSEEKAEGRPQGGGRHRRGPRPRFDIRETKDAYELYGEVPGIERKNVHVELTQQNVLLIKGYIERPYDIPRPKKGGASASGSEEKKSAEKNCDACECPKDEQCDKPKEESDTTTVRFLQRERFVGDFAREFAFPGPLSEFDITASLEGGILKVVAPKQQPSKGRKIEIK
ncbi:HSP20-like chaperone [Podospora australis]|uniref:HSP20-like chaperone n=1 Tax=Podospora australis TaxID=1536484 RepID=A0AAN6WIG9_9PEZI|nr:HSP20-like chaperone [Podospora australis]